MGVKSRPKELTPLDYDRKIVKNAPKSARKKSHENVSEDYYRTVDPGAVTSRVRVKIVFNH